MRHMRRPAPLPGQALIEFTACAMIFLALLIGTMQFGMGAFQRSAVDYEISRVGNDMPAGWEDKPAEQVVRDIIAEGTGLDMDRLSVANAKIEVVPAVSNANADPYATNLGGVVKTENGKTMKVSGDVSYPLAKGIGLVDLGTYTQHFERTCQVERRFEVS